MAEITTRRNDSRRGSISVEFSTVTERDHYEATVTKARGHYAQPGYSPAKVNWPGCGAQDVATTQAFATLLAHAAAYASVLDGMGDDALDAMGAAVEAEREARWAAAQQEQQAQQG